MLSIFFYTSMVYLKLSSKKWTCIALLVIIFFLWWLNYIDNTESVVLDDKESSINGSKVIPFFVVICKGRDNGVRMQQLKQARMMLKSAAALTRTTLSFKIFSDSESLFQDILQQIKSWPQDFQQRLQVDFEVVRYLEGHEDFRHIFKPCSTFRLQLPDLLQHIDAGIYIDTDVIFLNPPENLWKEFDNFDENDALAMAPDTQYGNRMKFPFLGKSGYQAGLMLMNLTRLRNVPGGSFTKVTHELYDQYKTKLFFGDQCLINIFFAKNPELLREISCSWNFIRSLCNNGRNACLDAQNHGASLVHGGGLAFFLKECFLGFFEAWEEYDLGTPIQLLIMKIQEKMAKYAAYKGRSLCANTTNISITLSKQLYL